MFHFVLFRHFVVLHFSCFDFHVAIFLEREDDDEVHRKMGRIWEELEERKYDQSIVYKSCKQKS